MERVVSLAGVFVFLFIAWGLSNNRRLVPWRTMLVGVAIQFVAAAILLHVPAVANAVKWLADRFQLFLGFAQKGSEMVFGPLNNVGFVFAIQVFTLIVFFSCFISMLYYIGVLPLIVRLMASAMRKTMRVSGTEALNCAANIFVGTTEAPLLIRPYLEALTLSELHAVVASGFGTIAASVFGVYLTFGIDPYHLLIASSISAPACLVMAKLMMPETGHSQTAGDTPLPKINAGSNLLDAAARGVSDGMHLSFNVIAMLVAFVALVAMVDAGLGALDGWIDGSLLHGAAIQVGDHQEYLGFVPGSLRTFFGTLFAPIAWLMGVPRSEAATVGSLLGLKTSLNELLAYKELGDIIKAGGLSQRSQILATYALCGFANFSSIGIAIGGLSALAPGRRSDLAKVSLRAMAAGALANLLTAAIVGTML